MDAQSNSEYVRLAMRNLESGQQFHQIQGRVRDLHHVTCTLLFFRDTSYYHIGIADRFNLNTRLVLSKDLTLYEWFLTMTSSNLL